MSSRTLSFPSVTARPLASLEGSSVLLPKAEELAWARLAQCCVARLGSSQGGTEVEQQLIRKQPTEASPWGLQGAFMAS